LLPYNPLDITKQQVKNIQVFFFVLSAVDS
jgi:hypothetical protein